MVDRLAAEGDPVESLETLASVDRLEHVTSEEDWRLALDRARARLLDQPGQHPQVQARILSIVELQLAEGEEAAREAAIEAFAGLAMCESSRESIMSFFQRGRGPSGH